MVTHKKVRGTASAMPVGVLFGTMLGIALLMVASFVLAWLIHSGKVRMSAMGYISMGILVLSASAAALLAILRVRRRKMLVGMITGGTMYVFLLVINILFFGGQYQGMLTTALMICIGSLLPSILRTKGQGSKKKAKTKWW